MSVSAQRDFPRLTLRLTEEQDLIIRKAAELQGWTLTEYLLCAILDRAERDLYERAARDDWETVFTATSAEPITTILDIFGE
jgi:uncharacterized protein (DUF1778 family)